MIEFPVAVVTTFPLEWAGGPTLRIRGIRDALGELGRCEVWQVECNHRAECRTTCSITREPSRPCRLDDFFDISYCPDYGHALAARLHREGIRTVVLSGLGAHRYVARIAEETGLHVVCDMHNVEAPLADAIGRSMADTGSRTLTPVNSSDIAQVEIDAVRHADEVWVCSEDDRELLESTYGLPSSFPIQVMPNVVDVPALPPRPVPLRRICFTGRLAYYPNTRAARFLSAEVAPRLAEAGCRLPVVIAGAVEGLPADFASDPGVTLIPDPDTTADVIIGGVMAVPLWEGGGSRLKILEAFALGAPVVSTAKGAEGLGAEPGRHYLLAEDADQFVDAILRLEADPGLAADLVRAGHRLVRDRYSVAALRDMFVAEPAA